VRHALEAGAARAAAVAVAALPAAAGDAFGRALARVAFSGLRLRRRTVEGQIADAFPGADAAWVRRTAGDCYRHFGREAAELARLDVRGAGDLPARVSGEEEVREVLARVTRPDRGVVIVTGHLGNWEVAGAFLAAIGVPLAAVVKRQRNPRFDALIRASRRRLGIEPVYMEDAYSKLPRLLAAGTSVALVADQDARRRGIFVPFLGRPASTFRGPARIALRTGAPLLFGAVVRDGGAYRAILEPVEAASEGPDAERALTAAWVARLDARVRRMPAQYFWFHRRWKTRPRNGEATTAVP
jgi:KDO2-lipid IV(A) lauroyltransferase